ncbi:uncharacterized protein LOC135307209 [Passer domesticus]|uniref:uncharacterized protein LOC135307209 n=1 Tax=Passer domesticus TaxID=48849 RepID=UPI0030FEB12B
MRREEKHAAAFSRATFRKQLMSHTYLWHTSYIPLKTGDFHKDKKKRHLMLAAARLAVPLFFHSSVNTFQATRSENDTEFHRAREGSGERAPPGRKRPPPVPPPQGAWRSHEPRSFGTYVTPRGRRRCCFSPFPMTNSFPRPPTPSVPWDKPAPAAAASFPRDFLFYGTPGTGKTLVACAVLMNVARVYQMGPSVVFLDEIDALAPVWSSKQDQVHRQEKGFS